jgi:hypothetical protein
MLNVMLAQPTFNSLYINKVAVVSSQYIVPAVGDAGSLIGITNLPAPPLFARIDKSTIIDDRAVKRPSHLSLYILIPVAADPDMSTFPKIEVDPVIDNDPEIFAVPVYGKVAALPGAYEADVANDELRDVNDLDDETAYDADVANDALTACKP